MIFLFKTFSGYTLQFSMNIRVNSECFWSLSMIHIHTYICENIERLFDTLSSKEKILQIIDKFFACLCLSISSFDLSDIFLSRDYKGSFLGFVFHNMYSVTSCKNLPLWPNLSRLAKQNKCHYNSTKKLKTFFYGFRSQSYEVTLCDKVLGFGDSLDLNLILRLKFFIFFWQNRSFVIVWWI